MIALKLRAFAEAQSPYVVRLIGAMRGEMQASEATLLSEASDAGLFSGPNGLLEIRGMPGSALVGDVVLVDPAGQRIERLIRARSPHNSLLLTERCDQLCVMCSQPPKKTHVDRFSAYTEAALLADEHSLIGISGGEPTLYKSDLFDMLETVLRRREDLRFHILTNGQHFASSDIERMRQPLFRHVSWGIPLYSTVPSIHDEIVGKIGAFERLEGSFVHLVRAGARVELRTVVLTMNFNELPVLAAYVASRLGFIESWSIMQLENIGFARKRWSELYVDHSNDFKPVAKAIERALLNGLRPQLFNFARCTVPEEYRSFAAASISDWKRRYPSACGPCTEMSQCSGFFEWHPESAIGGVAPL